MDSYALNCRSDGGPKEEELKSIYTTCLKEQDGKNSSNSRRYSDDQDWDEPHGYNSRRQWDRDDREREDRNRARNRNDRTSGWNDRNDRMGGRDGRTGSRDDRMNRRDMMEGRNDDMGSRNHDMTGHDDAVSRYHVTGRDDFPNSEEYLGDMSRNHNYYSSTQSSRRFRRDRNKEMNSGHRSQYNPNTQRPMEYEKSYRNEERNSSRNSSRNEDKKACALHCFLEHLEMTGDNGKPDKYLVTHVLTKDIKNEDLRDFLQESVEECFQILENENSEEKCDFSKNLLMCLSEKGRANCDDWKDDISI
uniref:Putative odorant binding protein 9 n=1 Tax=Corcyra cephalonica TaxID=139036 RepID=A0A8K1P7V3_CORCP|nr:putative odorant binding protein 9 [Corcyra cephalonica]